MKSGPAIPVVVGPPLAPGQIGSPILHNCNALIDTGATSGCITESLAQQLKLQIIDKRDVGGVGGKKKHNVYLATIQVPALRMIMNGELYGVDVPDGHPIILGRDFLNHTVLIYDGKTGTITICN